MEKLELSAQEIMDRLNWKKSKVYYWINSKKFETVDSPTGVKVLITQHEIEKYKSFKNSQTDYIESEIIQESLKPVQENSKISNNEVLMKAIETIQYMFDSQLNQTKMLTDSEHRTQSEYFELKAKFETLQESYKKLELENLELKKSKSLFSLFKKSYLQ